MYLSVFFNYPATTDISTYCHTLSLHDALPISAVWGLASPAAAHDELVSSDPAAEATVDALPDTVTLSFSGELLGGTDANEVQVTDAAGKTLNEGPAVVDGTTVTQSLAGDASGSIQVLWRVVSSDGHPISGDRKSTRLNSSH